MLITGGLGFIGSNLAHRLVEMGARLSLIDAMVPGEGGNLFNIAGIENKIELHVADIGDDSIIERVLDGVDYIFNLAGNVSHIDSMADPQSDLAINCGAQLKFLESCRKFSPGAKIVFTSTRQVYGKAAYLPVDERHIVLPPDINGIHKLTAENYHLLYYRLFGMRTVCLRLTNTYGPRQLMHHDRQGFIGWFIRKAMDGGTIELFGGGTQRRDLNYVDDVVGALLLAGSSATADGEILNLGGDLSHSLAEIADLLMSLTGSGSVENVPFPPERTSIDIGDFQSDFAKINTLLGWHPRTSLQDGLTCTIDFYRENREHYWTQIADSIRRSETTTCRD